MYAGRGAQTLLVLCASFIHEVIHSLFLFGLPTMYQVFTLGNVWKQFVECLVVFYETLKREKITKSVHQTVILWCTESTTNVSTAT